MKAFGDHKFCRCGKRGINVDLNQTEGQCRDEHGCDDSRCPLEGKFEPDKGFSPLVEFGAPFARG